MPADVRRIARAVWKDWVKPLAVILAVFGTFRSAVADWNDVPTGSMRPTILEGDRILVNKLAYGLRVPFTTRWLVQWDAPARGEIAVLFSPADGSRLVKRIVGLPGDTVELRNNILWINGKPVRYSSATEAQVAPVPAADRAGHVFASEQLDAGPHAVMSTPGARAARDFGPVTVPAGRYFVMGDNRDQSADSRYFGFVRASKIIGRSSAVAFSLDRKRGWMPRGSRFLKAID
jgi:signal peptidase I